jgi:hypothetical protein
MNRKAAIEFSANVIVIIIISSVILGLGLMLFFNLKSQATKYVDTVEQQTADQLKALMLNDNSKVAIYPNDLTISPGKSQMTTVAVSNNLDSRQNFDTKTVEYWKVEYYETPESSAIINIAPDMNLWKRQTIKVSENAGNYALSFGKISPGEQGFKNILIKMPSNSKKGQYIFTADIINYTSVCGGPACQSYGLIKLYVTVP